MAFSGEKQSMSRFARFVNRHTDQLFRGSGSIQNFSVGLLQTRRQTSLMDFSADLPGRRVLVATEHARM